MCRFAYPTDVLAERHAGARRPRGAVRAARTGAGAFSSFCSVASNRVHRAVHPHSSASRFVPYLCRCARPSGKRGAVYTESLIIRTRQGGATPLFGDTAPQEDDEITRDGETWIVEEVVAGDDGETLVRARPKRPERPDLDDDEQR